MRRRPTSACRGAHRLRAGVATVSAVVASAALLLGCAAGPSPVAESSTVVTPEPSARPPGPATGTDPHGAVALDEAQAEVRVPEPAAHPDMDAPDPDEVDVEPAPTPELTQPDRWTPGPGEVFPDAKQLAADTAQALTTYPHGSTPEGVAQAAGVPHVAAVLGRLVDRDAASAGTVVYPQMGGATEDAASIMVVLHQVRERTDGRSEEMRTLDLRLERTLDGWAVSGLASDGGAPADAPAELPPEAAAVLEHERIALPDSARWDIYHGRVDPGLLQLVLEIAEHQEIHAVTMSTGHPHEVFGANRRSNHARGLAIDLYAVDGVPVVEQRHDGSAAHRLARWLYDVGVPELGSPWAFDGHGGRSFTDVVHHDHLHIGVAPRPS